jgi:hypothetical protein
VPEDLGEALVEPPADPPICLERLCYWRFVVSAGKDDQRRQIGTVHVDVKTHDALWEPNDGRNKRYTLEAYAAYDQARDRVERAVAELPDVKAYCKRLFQWLLPSAALFGVLLLVEPMKPRVLAAIALSATSLGLSFHYAAAVHGPTWVGNPESFTLESTRARFEWHTALTGLYARVPVEAD